MENGSMSDTATSDANLGGGNTIYGETATLLINALRSRDAAEQEKLELSERVRVLKELCQQREASLQSLKMSLKLRTETIRSMENERRKSGEVREAEAELAALRGEISDLQKRLDRPCDVARFAAENLELRQELKRMREAYPGHNQESEELVRSRTYTWQLEQQISQLLQRAKEGTLLSTDNTGAMVQGPIVPIGTGAAADNGESNTPVNKRLRNVMGAVATPTSSPRQRMNENTQLEIFKLEQELARVNTELKEGIAREQEQRRQARDRETEMQAEVDATRSSMVELERALETVRIKAAVEVSSLREALQKQLELAVAAGSTQERPQDITEQLSAMVEELRSLRAANATLTEQIGEAEANQRKQKQAHLAIENTLAAVRTSAEAAETEHTMIRQELQQR